MNILILNWRDIRNPKSGGAEILTHEMAKRWVASGHSVTQFSSYFANAKKDEIINGVRIIRRGHPDARFLFFSVHFLAFVYYFIAFKGKFDVIIDEAHGLPFFTPLYASEKKVILICEVADELWTKTYGPIFGAIGRLIEAMYIRIIYKNVYFVTISHSTEKELISSGTDKNRICVLPMGINTVRIGSKIVKERIPTLLYVGRLSRIKGIEDALQTIAILKEKKQKIQIKIIGRGDEEYVNFLHDLCWKLQISENVKFLGYISEKEKFDIMASSHILISPSIKEGFGLTIPEAAHVGTPSIVYNSLGLSEIVKNCKTGIITEHNNPQELAREVIRLLGDEKLYVRLSSQAKEKSREYNWDNTSRKMLEAIGVTLQ